MWSGCKSARRWWMGQWRLSQRLGLAPRYSYVFPSHRCMTNVGPGCLFPVPGGLFMKKLRVFLADDHAVFRQGLTMLIDAQPTWKWLAKHAMGRR